MQIDSNNVHDMLSVYLFQDYRNLEISKIKRFTYSEAHQIVNEKATNEMVNHLIHQTLVLNCPGFWKLSFFKLTKNIFYKVICEI